MDEKPLSAEERALLAAWLKSAKSGAPLPTETVWADWLAGKLDEAAAAPLEQALAEDAGLRAALLAVREGVSEIASAEEVARARALVRPGRARAASLRWSWQSAAAASFVIAASGLGWAIGFSAAADAVNKAAASAMDILGTGTGL